MADRDRGSPFQPPRQDRDRTVRAASASREDREREREERRAAAEKRRAADQRRRERIREQRERQEQSRELARGPIDLPFCLLTLLLTAVGLVMLLSASFPSAYYEGGSHHDPLYYFLRQGIFAVGGVAAMFLIGRINYQRFRGAARILLYVAISLLILVIIPGNPIALTRNNATRWLGVGDLFTFQPSEIAKVAIVVYFANSISHKRERMRTFRYGIAPYALLLLLTAGLVGLEPHLSGAILILGVGAVLMLVGGINWAWVAAALAAGVGGLYVILFKIGYNASRIAMWRDPWIDPRGSGWQLSQSLITIGSGGLLGMGLGKSRQKFLYLPEEHNDFIFAIVCEELGLIGASIVMLLFAALVLRGYWIALHARDRFGSLLVTGVTTLVAMQTFLNIGVVTGLLPTTGIALPFFSYGGTALMIQLAEMGIVLSVSRQMRPAESETREEDTEE